jgi:phosphoglycolate phosphatase
MALSNKVKKFNVKTVLFDLDGTILDSVRPFAEAINVILRRVGLPTVEKKDAMTWIAEGHGDWSLFIPQSMQDKKEELMPKFEEVIESVASAGNIGEVHLIPGGYETLHYLSHKGFRLGLVTSTSTLQYLEYKLRPLRERKLDRLFEAIISDVDVPRIKPAPDPILECLRRMEVSPEEAIYVGDAQDDIIAGKAAGVGTVGVLTGVSDYETLRLKQPDMVLDSVADLRDFLLYDDHAKGL